MGELLRLEDAGLLLSWLHDLTIPRNEIQAFSDTYARLKKGRD